MEKTYSVWRYIWGFHYEVNEWGGSAFWLRTPLFAFGIYLWMREVWRPVISSRLVFSWWPARSRFKPGELLYKHDYMWTWKIWYGYEWREWI